MSDTICAQASAAGPAGVSLIRISGPLSAQLCSALAGFCPPPGSHRLAKLSDQDGSVIDEALVLFFAEPRSFTGEDVVELHVHGSPIVVDMVLKFLCSKGARIAKPGEFSERAFLNDKLDLAQAEAIADLISARSLAAARSAQRSLQGEFSQKIDLLVEELVQLRIYIEAALDFPEEEIDFLTEGGVDMRLQALLNNVHNLLETAQQGALLREGIKIALTGSPNVGKSTLLNTLTGVERAIVTDLPGTTRDILQQPLTLEGIPLTLLDTAGLHESSDIVEQEGMRRARAAIKEADIVLLVVDARDIYEEKSSFYENALWIELQQLEGMNNRLIVVGNKTDLISFDSDLTQINNKQTKLTSRSMVDVPYVSISAKNKINISNLIDIILSKAGYQKSEEGLFMARRRHLDALIRAKESMNSAKHVMINQRAGELVAEDLRLAQEALGEITGKVNSDELLGRIFSSFCIGK
jgi:tRNA modification GTPase